MRLVAVPPEPQLQPLMLRYRRVVAGRLRLQAGGALLLLLAAGLAAVGAEVRPNTFWAHLGNFSSYFDRLAQLETGDRVWTDPVSWFWGIRRWGVQVFQTVLIAYMATVMGGLLGLAGGVLASRNMGRQPVIRFIAARLLELNRTVPDVVFALIFVVAFGLGPLAGVLAMTLHTAGSLGKLFAEVIESADHKPVEGVQASSGSWFAQFRFGILPQVLSNLASYALLRFEINVRGATVIGFVGAGGIGQELLVAIRKFYYSDVSAILLMILACVVLIDWASGHLRHRMLALDTRRQPGQGGLAWKVLAAGGLVLFAVGLVVLDMSPWRIWDGLGQLGTIAKLMLPPETGGHLALYLDALGQTLSIAFLGTLLAAAFALPFGFLAARNVVASRALRLLTRRGLDMVRSVDTLIWALIWINVVGLGPFAGALAIACADFGALAKLMSEAVETADRKPVDGVLASGGGGLMAIRFGIFPQILPVFISQILYFFESNTRSASIIGIVGAGGIGLHLFEQIRVLEWQQVSFLVLMLLVTVAAIDHVSRTLRGGIIGRGAS